MATPMHKAKSIRSIKWNWFTTNNGDDCYFAEVGHPIYDKRIVKFIFEHMAQGNGDSLYYDIVFEDESVKRVYNPNEVDYETLKMWRSRMIKIRERQG